jgi:phosphatidylserine/phosphatidylglycerophosphate/cardiolipin synthase-like enzyme
VAYQVSAGSLMRLAQRATPFHLTIYPQERGLLLRQHRRSKSEIIRYCDEFIYNGQLERLANPKSLASLMLPPLGYIHIAGECTMAGGSRQNQQEAEAIASWLSLKREEILTAARTKTNPTPRLKDLVGIVTPFSGQKTAIQQALRHQGLADEQLTVGTVHALQGAERTIILFSPVYDASHRGSYFFDQGYNLLNVAVSRAKEVFLVVGNRCLFNPARDTPSGNLAKLLFEEPAVNQPEHELDNSFFYGQENRRNLPVPREHLAAVTAGKVDRLNELDQHRRALAWAINTAQQQLIIVSPFISLNAIQADGLAELIGAAKARQPSLRITVYTDAHLDAPRGLLHPHAQAGRAALRLAGAEVKIAEQIHNKTICLDNHALLEGSFNWLSAARSGQYVRHEISWFFRGLAWSDRIEQIVQEMEDRVVSKATLRVH